MEMYIGLNQTRHNKGRCIIKKEYKDIELIEILKTCDKSLRKLSEDIGVSRNKLSKICKDNNIKLKYAGKYSKSTIENIIRLFNDGLLYSEISNILNIPITSIQAILNRSDLGRKKYFSPNEHDFVCKYKELLSSRKMGEYYEVDKTTILNYANKIGFKNDNHLLNLPKDTIDYIIDSYHYRTINELSNELGISKSSVSRIWMDNGLKGKITNNNFNHNYFEKIDTPNKAYIVGLIASDGCIHKKKNTETYMCKISLHRKDDKILHRIFNEIGIDKKIYYGRTKETATLEIISKKIFKDLIKIGIHPAKTWELGLPNIPVEFESHYIRGYFDGDGSISQREISDSIFVGSCCISICGAYKSINEISSLLTRSNLSHYICSDKRKDKYKQEFKYIIFRNKIEKYNFIKWIYNDCGELYMERKKVVADRFIKLVEEKYKKEILDEDN